MFYEVWVGSPLGRWVVFVGFKCDECMSNSVVVEVLGDMVGPVSKYVFNGFT